VKRTTGLLWKKQALILLLFLILLLLRFCGIKSTFGSFLREYFFFGLYFAWGISIRKRLIQVSVRRYLFLSAMLLLLWMLLRTFKYNFTESGTELSRLLWYGYYIPFLLLPVTFLLTALCLGLPCDAPPPRRARLLLLPSALLISLFLTNDLHRLVFRFPQGLAAGDSIHHFGLLFWVASVWILICVSAGILTIAAKTRAVKNRRYAALPFLVIGLGIVYSALNILHLDGFLSHTLGTMPDWMCLIFILLAESCIDFGLIPSNSHYAELFSVSSLAAQITDASGTVRYRSERARALQPSEFLAVKNGPILLGRDTRLRAAPIRNGYILWEDDIRELNRLLDELRETGTRLGERTTLLRERLKLQSRRLHTQEQARIYDAMYRTNGGEIAALKRRLDALGDPACGRREGLYRLCLAGVYLKRRCNLFLIGESSRSMPAEELLLCCRETGEILRDMGVSFAVLSRLSGRLDPGAAMLLYALLETVVETAGPGLSAVLLQFSRDGGRIEERLEAECAGAAPGLPDRCAPAGLPEDARLSWEAVDAHTWRALLSVPEGGAAE
jgi:hypothetical protein